MTRDDYPEIHDYRFHYLALVYSETLVNIDGETGVLHSIMHSPSKVPETHREYAPLMRAVAQRRAEIAAATVQK